MVKTNFTITVTEDSLVPFSAFREAFEFELQASAKKISERLSCRVGIKIEQAIHLVSDTAQEPAPTKIPSPANILEEAARLVYGDRHKAYGPPSRNFQIIANLWAAYLNAAPTVHSGYIVLRPEDVAVLNILQKIARLVSTPGHRDSLIDIAGYAATIERLSEKEGETK